MNRVGIRLLARVHPTVGLLMLGLLGGVAAQSPVTPPVMIPNPSTAPQEGERQGQVVAIDGSLVAVAAPYADADGKDSGVVKIHDLTAEDPSRPVAILINPRQGPTGFGLAIGISGRRVVIGAQYDGTSANKGGIAYVYDLDSANPGVPIHTLLHPQPQWDGYFGQSVAISGCRVAIAAKARVFLYDLDRESAEAPALTIVDVGRGNPRKVAMDGDRLVIGYPDADPGDVKDAGMIGCFRLYDDWSSVRSDLTISNPEPEPGDQFGAILALTGDWLAVGVPNDQEERGTAFLFDLASEKPAESVRVIRNPLEESSFGSHVVLTDSRLGVGHSSGRSPLLLFDLAGTEPLTPVATVTDGGGKPLAGWGDHLVVGVVLDPSGLSSGGARVYDLGQDPPAEVHWLSAPSPATMTGFGQVVAMESGILAVGAPDDDTAGVDAGAVYLYRVGELVPFLALDNPAPTRNDAFGSVLGLSGTRLAVGVPGRDLVYLYELEGPHDRSVPVGTVANPAPDHRGRVERFGASLALIGDRLVVGAPDNVISAEGDDGYLSCGTAYVFDLAGEAPGDPAMVIPCPDPERASGFGGSIAIDGPILVIGLKGGDWFRRVDSGRVWRFDLRRASAMLPETTMFHPSPDGQSGFGEGIATGPQWIMAAAPGPRGWGGVLVFSNTKSAPFRQILQVSGATYTSSIAQDGNLLAAGVTPTRSAAVDLYEIGSVLQNSTSLVARLERPSESRSNLFGVSLAIDNGTLAIGAPDDSTIVAGQGAVYLYGLKARMEVFAGGDAGGMRLEHEQAEPVVFGSPGAGIAAEREFTIRNAGIGSLLLNSIALPTGFTTDAGRWISILAGESFTFRVRYEATAPVSGTLSVIPSNGTATNFTIPVEGRILAARVDGDGDGFSDVAEASLAGLGFDWQVSQPELVAAFRATANEAGFYTEQQLGALALGAPLLSRGEEDGFFRFTIDLRQSQDLESFTDLPLQPGNVSITPDGNLAIDFRSEADAAFFRLEAR